MSEIAANSINAIKVFKVLEIRFKDGKYESGWDDSRVGKECGGLAKAFVAQIRESEFGPLIDPEIAALRSDLASLREMAAQIEVRLTTYEKRIR